MSDEPLIAGPESTVTHALLRREPDHVRRIDWSYAGGIALLHLLALLAFVPWFFSWTGVILAVAVLGKDLDDRRAGLVDRARGRARRAPPRHQGAVADEEGAIRQL